MLRLNQNNLEEYLKKTEAEQIYMKKINSINMSFTSLLTSIQSVFSTYDYQLSTIANSLNILNINTSNLNVNTGNLNNNLLSLNSSLLSLSSSFTLYTSNNNNELNSIKSSINSLISHSNSVNSEISDLWEAISIGNIDYNYWKEFNKVSAETYIKYGNGQSTILDNEELEYKTYLSNFTLLNPNKLSYVFNSNVLQTDYNQPFNFGGDYDRIGLILPDCQSDATTYNQSVPMNLITATCKTLDVMLKYGFSDFNTNFSIKCLDANLINSSVNCDYNIISSNLNATAIHFDNYYKNGGGNFFSTFKLNDRVKILGPWLNDGYYPHIDLRRPTVAYSSPDYANLARLSFPGLSNRLLLHNHIDINGENGYGMGKIWSPTRVAITNAHNYVFDVQIDVANNNNICELLNSTTNINQAYTLTISPDFQVSYLYITIPNHVKLELPVGINSYNGENHNVRFALTNSNNTQSLKIEDWNALTCNLYGVPYITASYNRLKDLTVEGNTSYDVSSGLLSSITYDHNYVSWCKYINSCSSIINLDYNTFENFFITDIGKGFSFGAHFKNSALQLYAPSFGTYYSYNNPNATATIPQGQFKLLDFTCGTVSIAAGGSMENCVYNSLIVNAMNGTPPYGPWRYVWANSFELNNALTFYENKLCFDYAFYHCPFIQLGHTALNAGMNAEGYSCSGELMFVDNAPTTSVNFRLTGNNTSKSIHAKIMEDQQYVISADIRGWHPSRIIGFDQHYLFKNVASGYSAVPNQKFTAHVDNVNDWNAYKQFFDPFNDGQGANRVVFVQG